MQRYIFFRVIQAIFTILLVTMVVFMLVRITGDPVALMLPESATYDEIEEMREHLGLTKPIYVQYWTFISGLFRGDFGESIRWDRPTLGLWVQRIPNTLLLASAGMAFALFFGIGTGILSAIKVGSWFDNFGKIVAITGQALPVFWLGLMLMLLLGVNLRVLPVAGMGSWKHLIMPAFTLGWYITAVQTRLTRSAMLDVLDSEYIKMVRIKGVPESMVIIKHAFRNSLIPVVTMAALNFVSLINGTVVTETIFNWNGVGRLLVQAINSRDYPMVQTIVLIGSVLFVSVNLIADILYAYIDPRIRYGSS